MYELSIKIKTIFVNYFTLMVASPNTHRRRQETSELLIGKDTAVVNRKPQKQNHIITVAVPSETQTRYLPHTSLQNHHCTNQPGRQGQVLSKGNQRRDFIVVPGKIRDQRLGIRMFVTTYRVTLSTVTGE